MAWLALAARAAPYLIDKFLKGTDFADKIANALPTYEDKVTASVWGNAKSDKKSLFRLALAIAFGAITKPGDDNLVGAIANLTVPTNITAHYDLMGKAVTVELLVKFSGLIAKTQVTKFASTFLKSVPENIVCGTYTQAGWVFALENVIGAPPTLPTGTVAYGTISEIEGLNVQPGTSGGNAGPCGDNLGRGSFLQSLVFSKLASPCQLNQFYTDITAKQGSAILVTPVPNGTNPSAAVGSTTPTGVATPGSTAGLTDTLLTMYGGTVVSSTPTINTVGPTPSTQATMAAL